MPRDNPSCTITTSLGNFTAEIFLRQMPLTAANFIDLVEKRFYDGTHVHLLAPKMVLGMGCPRSKDPHSSKAGTGAAPDGSAFRAPDGRLVERLPGGYVRDEVGTEQLELRGDAGHDQPRPAGQLLVAVRDQLRPQPVG